MVWFCGGEREPTELLTALRSSIAVGAAGATVRFDAVLFVVNNFHPSRCGVAAGAEPDMSWQRTLATAWAEVGGEGATTLCRDVGDVVQTLSSTAEGRQPQRVLVTGSLLLVGDMLAELVRRELWAPSYPGEDGK